MTSTEESSGLKLRRKKLLILPLCFTFTVIAVTIARDGLRQAYAPAGVYNQVSWLEKKTREFEERRERIRDVCMKHAVALPSTVPDLLIDPVRSVAACRNAKVGTGTLLTHFISLADITEKEKTMWKNKLYKIVPDHFSHTKLGLNSIDDLKEYIVAENVFTFSFVRHPFDRLSSAFDNKIFHRKDYYYFSLADKLGANFTAFAVHVLEDLKKNKCSAGDGYRKCSSVDTHWKPMLGRCAYCHLPYNVVGDADTFDEDLAYVSSKTHLSLNLTVRMHFERSNRTERTKELFAQLEPSLRKALHEAYKLDFELFGYSPEPYL